MSLRTVVAAGLVKLLSVPASTIPKLMFQFACKMSKGRSPMVQMRSSKFLGFDNKTVSSEGHMLIPRQRCFDRQKDKV